MIVVNVEPFSVEAVENKVLPQDGEQVTVDGRLDAHVFDPVLAATRVVDYIDATRKMFQTTIRAVVKGGSAAEFSNDIAGLEAEVTRILPEAVRKWGVAVSSVSLNVRAAEERD